jgi:hypothetical protein
MKMKACNATIKMWKMAQMEPAMMWPMGNRMPLKLMAAALLYKLWISKEHRWTDAN